MDYILRATVGNGSIRAFIADTRETVQKAFEIHQTSPVMSAALGRCLTAAAIMGTMLKSDDDLITINIQGNGPGRGVTVTSDSKAMVKGYCYENIVDIPLKPNGKLDVRTAIGEGTLTVIKDMGLKEPYIGQIPLVSGEIADDLTYYFAKSEQTPSSVALGVLVDRDYSIKQAGGFILQVMPDADDEIITHLENKLPHIKPVTEMLDEGMTPENILNELFEGYDKNILDKIPVDYHCNCTKERVERALISIGEKELTSIIEEDKNATLHCHFCNTDYNFNENELRELLTSIKK